MVDLGPVVMNLLLFQGMTPMVEDKLLSMKEKLLKIAQHKSVGQKSVGQKQVVQSSFNNGALDLSHLRPNSQEVSVRTAPLTDQGVYSQALALCKVFILPFCSTRLPLANASWVRSTFSRLSLLSPASALLNLSNIEINFQERTESNPRLLGLDA